MNMKRPLITTGYLAPATAPSNFPNSIRNTFFAFDDLFNEVDKLWNMELPNYPHYNLVSNTDESKLLEVAVAGFSKDDIKVWVENNNLNIKASKEKTETNYTHKGISSKDISLRFYIGNIFEIESVKLENGILSILMKKINTPENIKFIEIK